MTREEFKAVILAAGSSTRMRPLSFSESKVMLPFLGKPLLAYHVNEFIKNKITEFVIICNEYNFGQIKKYFDENYPDYNFNYTIQTKLLGPSHAIYSAKHLIKNQTFIVKYGDSVSSEDQIAKLLETYGRDINVEAVVTLRKVENPQEYGIAKFNAKKQLIQIIEKPKQNFPSHYALVGLYILKESFFTSAEKIGFGEIIPAPEYILHNNEKVSYWITNAKHIDLGRPPNILEATKLFIDKYGRKNESYHVYTNKISPKSYIGCNAFIKEDVEIGDYCHVDCYIDKCSKINNSYIMEGTKIGKNCIINSSVVGRNNILEDNFITINKEKELGIFTGENVIVLENLKSYSNKIIYPNKIIKEDVKEDLKIMAILFDIDNTLIKTREVSNQVDMAAMQIFEKHINLPSSVLYQKWKEIISQLKQSRNPEERTRKYSYSKLANILNINKKITENAYKNFLRELINFTKPYEHVHETLSLLRKYKIAAFTEDSKGTTLAKLKTTNLLQYFNLVITSNDTNIMKPNEEYYNLIFKKLNLSPNECLVIGDNYEKDLEIAKNIGCKTICFGSDKRADYQITNFSELIEILKRH